MTIGHWILVTLGFFGLFGLTVYDHQQTRILDQQSPIVETCVKHRVSQHVEVHSP